MPQISRVRVAWSGFIGAPGVSTFYCLDVAGLMEPLHDWFYGALAFMPPVVTIATEGSGDIINTATGVLEGAWVEDPGEPQVGRGDPDYSAPVGAIANWYTEEIAHGHRVRGKTFLVPLSQTSWNYDGQMKTAQNTTMNESATTLVEAAAGNFSIWHRPVGGAGGTSAFVTLASVPKKAAVLSSRRD